MKINKGAARIVAAAMALGAVLFGGAAVNKVAPADAATVNPYTGQRFRSPNICLEQNIDLSYGLQTAANAWNVTALNLVVKGSRTVPGGCGAYPASQKVVVRYYSAANGSCATASWTSDSSNWITWAEIRINLAYVKVCGVTNAGKAALLMHEVAHVGGLGHVPESNSIVCGNTACASNLKPSGNDLYRMNWRWANSPRP